MDDLVTQLRQLGDAVEAETQAVTLDDIADRTVDDAAGLDIGLAHRTSPQPLRSRRTPSPRMLGAAAALLVVVAGSIAFIGRPATDEPLDLASAIQLDGAFAVPTDDNGWQQLRECESTNIYDIDTGNTFYGAYQLTREMFRDTAAELSLDVWAGTTPAEAAPEVQDVVANAMYLERGDEPWPICGRYLKGPMITPVVPQWLGASQPSPDGVFVFISPTVTSDRLDQIEAELSKIVLVDSGGAAASSTEIKRVDKEQAFAEFQEDFANSDDELQSVSLADVPARFEVARDLTALEAQQVRDISGVFEIVEALPAQPFSAPMRLSIPAIGLETPVYPTTSLTDLSLGAVVMVENPLALVIGGYGSAPGSVFGRLDELRDGDTIIVSTLIVGRGASWEIARTFKVDLSGKDEPAIFDLDNMLFTEGASTQRLMLVADVDGDPLQRLVVHTQSSAPDLNNYPS